MTSKDEYAKKSLKRHHKIIKMIYSQEPIKSDVKFIDLLNDIVLINTTVLEDIAKRLKPGYDKKIFVDNLLETINTSVKNNLTIYEGD